MQTQQTPFSAEQTKALDAYAKLLTEWNQKVNLVSPNTVPGLWERHIEDSAQLAFYLPEKDTVIADIGSGAGLPGIVLSALGYTQMHLVESDQKKAIFLQEAARVCEVKPTIHNERVERLSFKADIIVARAFAGLADLLKLTRNIAKAETKFVLLKGENVADELSEAQRNYTFTHSLHPSRTGPGFILIIEQLQERI